MNQSIENQPDWRASAYAAQYFEREREFLRSGLRQSIGPSVLQLGSYIEQQIIEDLDLPFLVRSECHFDEITNVVADPAFLPFEPDSFATVVLPHVLEGHVLPHQVLREAHRVLMSEGHIVITGFNPFSLIGLQRIVRRKAVCAGRYYTVKRVIDWLQLLGFEVISSSMYQYSPLFKNPRFRSAFSFLETVGDRWLPMTGGGYMICAKKREVSGTLVGKMRFKKPRRKIVGAAASVKAGNSKSHRPPLSDS